jgi:hypothetical protein
LCTKKSNKTIPGFHNLSYPERIRKLKLPTIAHRRIRGDMIETYKLINEKYDLEASSFLKLLSSSGNRFSRRNNSNKIVQQRYKTSLRKYSFAMRVAKVWLQLAQWFLRRRFLCEFSIGSYVKLGSAVGAILIEGPNRRTHFWKNFCGMILGWPPSKIVSGDPDFQPRWPPR